jgi:TPR repeat protein
MTTLDRPLNPATRRSVLQRAYASSKLAKMTTTALVVCVLVNTPVALAQPAQPIRQAEVLEVAPKIATTQATKIALVIGNAQYTDAGKLGNPVNDATDLAAKLKAVGFTDPILAINQTTAQFKQTLKTFRSRLRPNAEVVVYYAGHGMSVDGMNYLLPVDVKLESKADLEDEAIPLKRIIKEMSDAQVKTSVLILDSCRNNPFSRSWKSTGSTKRDLTARGWSSEAVSKAAAGIKIFYATSDGEVANDGAGRNGHFTSSLLRHIDTPGMSLNDMIDQVTADLSNDPKVKQTPWSEGSMIGTYYFKPPAAAAKNAGLIERILRGDQLAMDEFYRNDPEASKKIDEILAQMKSHSGRVNQPQLNSPDGKKTQSSPPQQMQASAPADKQTATLLLAQQQSDDVGQRQLGTAMAEYVSGELTSVRYKLLSNMMLQGNEFAALMLHRIEVAKLGKSQVQIPPALLVKAGIEIERLSQAGDLVAISWHANIYRDGLLGRAIDDNKAFTLMKQAADKNYPYALYVLGHFYSNGKGITKDDSKAIEWYKKSADAGNKSAQHSLGHAYRNGALGVKPDGEQAKNWYLKAIENGSTDAMVDLASMYSVGKVVTKNEAEALKLIKKAADEKNQYGQITLGSAYRDGALGLKLDGEQARNWYLKAIENGSTDAMVNLAWMYEQGKELSKNEAEALMLFRKAADEKNQYGQTRLGQIYRDGSLSVKPDGEQAKNWYLKAIENGSTDAMVDLGAMYTAGKIIVKNDAEALKLFKKAADGGNQYGQQWLGNSYRDGALGLKQDGEQAKIWYLKAIENDTTDAMVELGAMYTTGKIIAKNEAEALKLFKKAADGGNQFGQQWLGKSYRDGTLGLKQDGEQAKNWYLKAIESGSTGAMVDLGAMYTAGKIIVKNDAEALKLFKKAADGGNQYGQQWLGNSYRDGAPGLTPDGEQAKSWYIKAIDNDSKDALVELAWLYEQGKVVAKNEAEALKLYKKAAEASNQFGQKKLGSSYRDGKLGLKQDGEQAKNWYLKAIENGSTDAMVDLGVMYEDGKILSKNETEALKLFQKAAESENQYGQRWLGYAYRNGALGLKQDGEQATKWYLKAIESGSTKAMIDLANLYIDGSGGVVKDENKGFNLYKKAVELGDTSALSYLAYLYREGNGVEKNENTALQLYQKADTLNQKDGTYSLGLMHWRGQGGLQVDKTEANRLFRKAADLGHEDAIKFLAK